MIPVSTVTLESPVNIDTQKAPVSWQKQLANSFRNSESLLDYLQIAPGDLPYELDNAPTFRTRVTEHFASLMTPQDPFDPLLLQVLPQAQELHDIPGFSQDPLQESEFSPLPGLIHKYKNRALIIAHQACAIHCRYCFRRHFPYENASLSKGSLDDIVGYLSEHPEINEVILSGGDPLSLSDDSLGSIIQSLSDLPQISVVRIHSRTPIMLPSRITEDFIEHCRTAKSRVVLVIHCNHPKELCHELSEKLARLAQAGVTLLNQTVLLKHINDKTEILVELSERLFAARVLPYYLHLLDPIAGAHHFLVEDDVAQALWSEMQTQLSGFLLPRLVREVPMERSKTWKNPSK